MNKKISSMFDVIDDDLINYINYQISEYWNTMINFFCQLFKFKHN